MLPKSDFHLLWLWVVVLCPVIGLAQLVAPDPLTVTVISGNEIQLDWSDNTDEEDGYVVHRKPYAGVAQWHELAVLSDGTTHYVDSENVHGNVSYTYRIGAFQLIDPPREFTVDDIDPRIVYQGSWEQHPSPGGCIADTEHQSNDSAAAASLTFIGTSVYMVADVQSYASDARVYIDGVYEQTVTLNHGPDGARQQIIFVIDGLHPTEHTVRIERDGDDYLYLDAFRYIGWEVEPLLDFAPFAPANPIATAYTPHFVLVQWDNTSFNEQQFHIERKEPGGTFAEVATTGMYATSFADTSVEPGLSYVYRVRASNSFGSSGYSDECSATSSTGQVEQGVILLSTSGAEVSVNTADGYISNFIDTANSRTVATDITPWNAVFDGGSMKLEYQTIAGEMDIKIYRQSPEACRALYAHPQITVMMDIELDDNYIKLTPILVHNNMNPIHLYGLEYPAEAYHPIDQNTLAIGGSWGGLAYTYHYMHDRKETYSSGMPFATHDILLVDHQVYFPGDPSNGHTVGVYSEQPIGSEPYRPTLYRYLGTRYTSNQVGLCHMVRSWTPPNGIDETMPPVYLQQGNNAFDIFSGYRQRNQMDTWQNLDDKLLDHLTADQVESLKNAVHTKLNFSSGYSFQDAVDWISDVNDVPYGPHLFEMVGYWEPYVESGTGEYHYFDAKYPDFHIIGDQALPPPPSGSPVGGLSDFLDVINAAHNRFSGDPTKMGDLISGYTNPTWWHEDAEEVQTNPAFARDGMTGQDAIAVRRRTGEIVRQYFGHGAEGFAVAMWRQSTRDSVANILQQLKDWGMDVMFQDQYGTRYEEEFASDYTGKPYGYMDEGILQMANASAQVMPVASEGVSYDRSFKYIYASMGNYLPCFYDDIYYDRWALGHWTMWPLGTLLLHDKLGFYVHNLSSSVRTSETLSWSLAYGMNMHCVEEQVNNANGVQMLRGLAHVQRNVCSRVYGKLAKGFQFTDDALEVSVTWYDCSPDNDVYVIANHVNDQRGISLPNGPYIYMARYGFVACEKISDQPFELKPICGLVRDDSGSNHYEGLICNWQDGTSNWDWSNKILWRPAALEETHTPFE